jgi:hypothetical protein
MSKRHVLEELSAYIDGEARHPKRIERHLSQCPDCARRHMELLKLSSHLGAMKDPEVAPAFLTRVLAHAREEEMLTVRGAWLTGMAQWGAALALIVAGLALLYGVWPDGGQSTTALPVQVAVDPNAAFLDDEHIVEAMAELMEEGVDLTYVASDTPRNWLLDDDSISYDEAVALLVEDVTDEDAATYQETGSNVYGLIDGMETSETETLESLLADYMGKG